MKFEPDTLAGVNTISRHEAGRVHVGAQEHVASVIVPWEGAVLRWPLLRWADLDPALLQPLVDLEPELVIFGSGSRLVFPPAAVLRPLIDRRIGFETMDTAAACRTYNVLVTERRRVVAALFLGGASA